MGKGSRRLRSAKPNKRNVRNKRVSMPVNELGRPGLPEPVVDMLGRKLTPNVPKNNVLLLEASALDPKKNLERIRDEAKARRALNRRVMVMKDHTLEYPSLYLSIFIQGDTAVHDDESRFAFMFARADCRRAKSVLEADLVVFGGGSDVDPALYSEAKHHTTYSDRDRDDNDMVLYALCLEHGIPMFGVCRGAQFLHVMNGGKLFQDVDGHYGDHSMHDLSSHQIIEKVSSVHHQMVRENKEGGMEVIATCTKSTKRHKNPIEYDIGAEQDIEAFFYRETCCIGVQGHPEYSSYNFYTKWCLDLINELVLINPDIDWVGEKPNINRRIRPALLAQRASIIAPKETLKCVA